MNNNAFEVLREEYPELAQWLKLLCRYDKTEDFVIADYKNKRINLKIYTKDNKYRISAVLPGIRDKERFMIKDGEYKIDEGDSRVTMLYSDYRKVNDVVVPYFMKNTIKGPETSEGIEIQTISFNENVPDNTFNAPMEVLFRDAQKIQPIPGPEQK